MSLIRNCNNQEALELVWPYLGGKEVGWINNFLSMLDTKSYEQIRDYAIETHDVRMQTVLDITGEELKKLL